MIVILKGKKLNIKKLLGKRIKEIRKSKNLTQDKVAEIINIETTSLSNIENGKYYPTADNLEKIIKVLDIQPYKLFQFEHLAPNDDLQKEIVDLLNKNPERIKDIYKIVKALLD